MSSFPLKELDQLSYSKSPSCMKEKLIAGTSHLQASIWWYGVVDHALLKSDVEHVPHRKFEK